MSDQDIVDAPAVLEAIRRDTAAMGFTLASEPKTGSLLRSLAASKPKGTFLELGTGTGVGTAWLLAGMDSASTLVTIDNDAKVVEVARRHLGRDPRVTFQVMDGSEYLERAEPLQFDFIYADAWPGKFLHLDLTLSLLKFGGIYLVDDLLPQSSWPEGHASRVPVLISDLQNRQGFVSTQLAWASGLMMLVRKDAV